jgi:hypothetical protein
MKNKGRILVILLVGIFLSTSCGGKAQAQSSGGRASPTSDFSYDLSADGKGIKITRYTGSGGAVIIPSKIEEMPVVEIGNNAFIGSNNNTPNNRDAITSIVIPVNVVTIGYNAFSHINELTKATLPDGVRIIPTALFYDCKKLTTVNLPASLEEIDSLAFLYCGELNNLIIPDSLSSIKFTEYGKVNSANQSFAGCGKLPIATRQKIQGLGYTGTF